MKHTLCLLSLFVLTCQHTTLAQITLSDSYRIFPDSRGNMEKIRQVSPGNFLVFGKAFGHGFLAMLDPTGAETHYNSLQDEVGGIRSQITDVVVTPTHYFFVGDCDSCGLFGDPSRQVLYLKTDRNLNVVQKKTIPPPLHMTKKYSLWGYEMLRRDGDQRFITLIQLIHEKNDTAYSDFVLYQIDENLDLQFSSTFDYQPLDNIADIVVTDDSYFILSWGVRALSLGSDTMRLTRMDKTYTPPAAPSAPKEIWQRSYRGVGFRLVRAPSGDWIIGGASTENIFRLSEAMLMLTDGNTGIIKNKKTWGTPLFDGIRDLLIIQNGQLLASVVEKARFPDSTTIRDFQLGVNAYPDTWPHPTTAKIMRFNPLTLDPVAPPVVFPSGDTTDIILRSVWPTTPDGSQFVACGQFKRRPVFFTRSVFAANSNDAEKESETNIKHAATIQADAVAEKLRAKIYPNPASCGQLLQIELPARGHSSPWQVDIFDALGRNIYSASPPRNTSDKVIEIPAPPNRGWYYLLMRNEQGVADSQKLLILD